MRTAVERRLVALEQRVRPQPDLETAQRAIADGSATPADFAVVLAPDLPRMRALLAIDAGFLAELRERGISFEAADPHAHAASAASYAPSEPAPPHHAEQLLDWAAPDAAHLGEAFRIHFWRPANSALVGLGGPSALPLRRLVQDLRAKGELDGIRVDSSRLTTWVPLLGGLGEAWARGYFHGVHARAARDAAFSRQFGSQTRVTVDEVLSALRDLEL